MGCRNRETWLLTRIQRHGMQAIDRRCNGWSGLAAKAMVDCEYQYRRDVCFKQWTPSWLRQRGREGLNLTKSVARAAFGQWAGLGGSETGAYSRDCALGCYTWCPAMGRADSLAFDLVVK
jgi:hypothetical protein